MTMDSPNAPRTDTTSPEMKAMLERGRRSSQALTGVLLIVLGGLFLIDRMGDQWGWHLSFHHLWPVLLIVAGLGVMFSHQDSEIKATTAPDGTVLHDQKVSGRRYGDGFFLTLVGVLMLAHMNRWMLLSQSWPLFIVAAGVSMIFGRGRGRRRMARMSRREYR